ncbi:MAG: tRNA 4-thiouridine(8) synthase ThiI [Spirochaetales bacterium]|nr:tRNA 4-thiouridine(8) synthase ThiI [Spirochaetales bacterium]
MAAMNNLWLIKVGEISLKKGNRAFFERVLKENIRKKLRLVAPEGSGSQISNRGGRFYLDTSLPEDLIRPILASTPGIVAFSRALKVKKDLDSLTEASIEVAKRCLAGNSGNRFKFEVRRTDKGLPLDSYGYARELGARLLEALPELVVDVRKPDFIIKLELREWGYVYEQDISGPGGLPVGTAGRGMLLLSGGIDSPVAGYLMAKRGITLSAVHFHTPPFTSPEALDKVIRLAESLAPWCGGITLANVSFTDCQVKINESVDPASTTLHSRATMMKIAQRIAAKRRCGALVTGESLGQVASQTLESLAYTNGSVHLPVFRPLIGLDKEQIIRISRDIGTYETAIEPFDDCCTLFSPTHPLTRPDTKEMKEAFTAIDGLEALIEEAAEKAEIIRIDGIGQRIEG